MDGNAEDAEDAEEEEEAEDHYSKGNHGDDM